MRETMRAGSNGSKASTFSPSPANLTGRPVTAARVAVELGENDPGDADPLVELIGAPDRVLPGQGVGHVEDLAGLRRRPQGRELFHELVVDVESPGRVHDHDVVPHRRRLGEGRAEDGQRLRLLGVVHLQLGPGGDRSQLLPGRRPVHVGGHQQRVAAPTREPAPEARGSGGLSRALEPGQQDHRGRSLGFLDPGDLLASEEIDHLVAHHADHRLVGVQAPQDLLADGAGPDSLEKLLHDPKMDVGLEQRETDLAERGVHVGLGQESLAAQRPEDTLKPLAQRIEQRHVTQVADTRRRSAAG
jgi:hypothetical protein